MFNIISDSLNQFSVFHKSKLGIRLVWTFDAGLVRDTNQKAILLAWP